MSVNEDDEDDTLTDKDGNRPYTEEEVYRVIQGMEAKYGLDSGSNKVSDYV